MESTKTSKLGELIETNLSIMTINRAAKLIWAYKVGWLAMELNPMQATKQKVIRLNGFSYNQRKLVGHDATYNPKDHFTVPSTFDKSKPVIQHLCKVMKAVNPIELLKQQAVTNSNIGSYFVKQNGKYNYEYGQKTRIMICQCCGCPNLISMMKWVKGPVEKPHHRCGICMFSITATVCHDDRKSLEKRIHNLYINQNIGS